VRESYLGLGSNLADRAANLWEAVRRIQELPNTQVVALSRLCETEPVGPVKQGWFLNVAVRVVTSLEPAELLAAVKRIEHVMGRMPTERWGPRLIDIDVLLYGEERIQTHELTIPHPELWNRRFVLIPLLDVLPEGDLARQVRERLAQLGEDGAGVRPLPEGQNGGRSVVREVSDSV
jgi:2-amino-4-hydroxy-6-hydroxymethyldihydropteridine diphosphokinase